MALITLSKILLHPEKPDTLRVKTVHARSAVSKEYTRLPKTYMGVAVPQEEANEYATALQMGMQSFTQNGRIVKKSSGRTPPDGMLLAYSTSASNIKGATWISFWRYRTPYELLEEMTDFPDGTQMLLEHGTEDIHVPYQDTLDTVNMLRAKFPNLEIECVLHDGKDHAWDYNLNPSKLRAFFDLY